MGQELYDFYDLQNHKIKETHSGNADIGTWYYDYFGRLLAHQDLGGNIYQYTYNYENQKVMQTSNNANQPVSYSQLDSNGNIQYSGVNTAAGQSLSYDYYQNGQLERVVDNVLHSETFYQYDAQGHHTRERYMALDTNTASLATYQDARMTYDELGRLAKVYDNRYNMTYSYDAVGNRRHTVSNYYDNTGTAQTTDYWYLFDAVNHITTSEGVLNSTTKQISISSAQGTQLGYDAVGNRRTATYYQKGATTPVVDSYTYYNDNLLEYTYESGSLTSARTYDLAGRVTTYVSYSSPGVLNERRVSSYNNNGWLLEQDNYNSSNTLSSIISYTNANAYDAAGNVNQYSLIVPNSYTNTYNYVYVKYDSYKQSVVQGTSTYFSAGNTTSTYDINGNLISVTDRFQANNNRSFTLNAQGHILQKTENGKLQYYYYANGNPVGSSGDINPADFDYNYTPVSDSYPSATPASYTVSSGDTLQSIALAVYGDANLWYIIADANGIQTSADLKIGQTLVVPNKITNIHNDSTVFKPYNAGAIIGDTTPTLPDPPPPPPPPQASSHGHHCNIIAMIIVIIVAIVATILTAGAAAAAFAPAVATIGGATGTMAVGGAVLAGTAVGISTTAMIGAAVIGAAVGSVASQLVGIGLGVQSKFSWGAVATSALGAGVTAGIGSVTSAANAAANAAAADAGTAAHVGIAGTMGLEGYGATVVNGIAGNVISQGVNMITGQQSKFSWQGVAIAAVSAPLNNYIDKQFDVGQSKGVMDLRFSWNGLARNVGSELVKSAVQQEVSIAVNHEGKMDWQKVAADGFGNAIGNDVVKQMQFSSLVDAGTKKLQQTQKDFTACLADGACRERMHQADNSNFDKPKFIQTDVAFNGNNKDLAAILGPNADVSGNPLPIAPSNGGTSESTDGIVLAWVSGKFGFPDIHGASIERLSIPETERDQLRFATVVADEFQKGSDSYMHAMSNGVSTPEQARAMANDWVRYNMMVSADYKAAGNTDMALFHAGVAMHDVQDVTSPAHGFEHVWTGNESPLAEFFHVNQEMRDPGIGSNLDRATQDVYRMYKTETVRSGDIFAPYGKDFVKPAIPVKPTAPETHTVPSDMLTPDGNLVA